MIAASCFFQSCHFLYSEVRRWQIGGSRSTGFKARLPQHDNCVRNDSGIWEETEVLECLWREDLGQLWPEGKELSHRNRVVIWEHLSRRQHACRHQACTILGRLLCSSPAAHLHYFVHFICSTQMHFKSFCLVQCCRSVSFAPSNLFCRLYFLPFFVIHKTASVLFGRQDFWLKIKPC